MVSQSTFFMCEELKRRGYSLTYFDDPYCVQAQKGAVSFFINASKTSVLSANSYLICQNKYLCKQILQMHDFPTSKFFKITKDTNPDQLNLAYPLVAKPIGLKGGEGVEIGLNSASEVKQYIKNHPDYKEILIEEQMVGFDVRVLIVRGKFFSATRRLPAFVVGDGISSIKNLINSMNSVRNEVERQDKVQKKYTTSLRPILYDSHVAATLKEAGYDEDSIVKKGQRVYVRKNGNLSTGGVAQDVTDQVCKEIQMQCEKLASILHMTLAGIDIIVSDLSRPLSNIDKSGFIEVNSSPGIDMQILVSVGKSRNPVPLLIDEIEDRVALPA